MVSSQGHIRPDLPQVAHTPDRRNKKLPQFVSPVPDKEAWALDAMSILGEDMDGYAFPQTPLIANVVNKILSNNCHRIIVIARLAQHVMVLVPGDTVNSPSVPTLPNQPSDSTLQQKPTQGLSQSELPYMAPRASTTRVQGFSGQWQNKLRLLRDAQPEQSIRRSCSFLVESLIRVMYWVVAAIFKFAV